MPGKKQLSRRIKKLEVRAGDAEDKEVFEEMAGKINQALGTLFKGWYFEAKVAKQQAAALQVTYLSIPAGTTGTEFYNASHHLSIFVYPAPGANAADKVKTKGKSVGSAGGPYDRETTGVKFRNKTGAPDKIVAYLIQFFKKNAKTLKTQRDKDAWKR
jgi:hypothetical protein